MHLILCLLCFHINWVTMHPSLPGTVHMYACCPAIIINIFFFSCQNHPSLDNKLHVHPAYKHSSRQWGTFSSDRASQWRKFTVGYLIKVLEGSKKIHHFWMFCSLIWWDSVWYFYIYWLTMKLWIVLVHYFLCSIPHTCILSELTDYLI